MNSSLRALQISLDDSDRMAIAIRYSFAAAPGVTTTGRADSRPTDIATLPADQGPTRSPEVVLHMGIQGAGKSDLVQQYVDHGYIRLNRDLLGGKPDDLARRLEEHLAAGETRVVLDNTYPTRLSRAPVIEAAWKFGVAVRCRYLETSVQDAHVNIAHVNSAVSGLRVACLPRQTQKLGRDAVRPRYCGGPLLNWQEKSVRQRIRRNSGVFQTDADVDFRYKVRNVKPGSELRIVLVRNGSDHLKGFGESHGTACQEFSKRKSGR